jgi:hypothetical protein
MSSALEILVKVVEPRVDSMRDSPNLLVRHVARIADQTFDKVLEATLDFVREPGEASYDQEQ